MNARYWNETTFDAVSFIQTASHNHQLALAECTYRWLVHHSQLGGSYGDALIVGASSVRQLENNLSDVEKRPLPDAVVQAFEKAWQHIQYSIRVYWH